MPVTVIVGGQFGSEGKGKVAQHFALAQDAHAAVRVGGANSGHTTLGSGESRQILRHLPTAAVLPGVVCVLPAGSYLRVPVLLDEIERTRLPPDRLVIDRYATVISDHDVSAESGSGLGNRIGSTCSGTGAAVIKRINRRTVDDLALGSRELQPYVGSAAEYVSGLIAGGHRIVVEGTQGFGLSLLHSPHFPMVTSRDTTAAAALSEAGLSPLDVDAVVLVLRALPIRVAGRSGPFNSEELDWETVRREAGHSDDLTEYTSVTGRIRRVARFDPELVRQAIAVNRPTTIVLNHVDHIDARATTGLTEKASAYVDWVSREIGQRVDLVGLGPDVLVPSPSYQTSAG